MKKFKEWLDRQTGTVWFACLLNIVILAVMLLFLKPGYETNDDISVSMIANGSWGTGKAHVICQNYLMGLLYTVFYRIGHGVIPWYPILQYAFLLAAFSTVTYVIFQKLKSEQAMLMSSILLIYFGYECYIRMQYSKTAGVMLAAGALILYYEIEKEKTRWYGILWGILLGFTGSLYRFEETAICCILMAGIGIYFLLDARRWGVQMKKKLILLFSSFIFMGALMVGAELFDQYIYASDPKWDAFMKYNNCRSDLTDYSRPDYEENKALYNELGITKTAYSILEEGLNFGDPDVFSLETLEKLDALRPKNTLSKALVINFLKEYPIGYSGMTVFFCFLMVAFLWLFWGEKNKKVWIVVAYEILAMGMIDFYLYYSGRYLKNRVEAALWFAISLTAIWFYQKKKIQISKKAAFVAVMGLLIVNQRDWKGHWRVFTKQQSIDQKYLQGLYDDVRAIDPDGLYLAKIETISYTFYDMLDSIPQGTFENVIWYGGWEMENPIWKAKLAEYNIENPYRDLINKEHVYLVDHKIDLTLQYIREYYDENVEAEKLQDNGRWPVYRLVSKKSST